MPYPHPNQPSPAGLSRARRAVGHRTKQPAVRPAWCPSTRSVPPARGTRTTRASTAAMTALWTVLHDTPDCHVRLERPVRRGRPGLRPQSPRGRRSLPVSSCRRRRRLPVWTMCLGKSKCSTLSLWRLVFFCSVLHIHSDHLAIDKFDCNLVMFSWIFLSFFLSPSHSLCLSVSMSLMSLSLSLSHSLSCVSSICLNVAIKPEIKLNCLSSLISNPNFW